jgi:hypothetical protein
MWVKIKFYKILSILKPYSYKMVLERHNGPNNKFILKKPYKKNLNQYLIMNF